MNTKIVYVLVSSENDYYLEQAQISAYSLKYHNPSAHVIWLVDDVTGKRLTILPQDQIEFVDEVISVELDSNYSPMQRSRALKTSVREHIDGDFLFIDTDTIILGDLSQIDKTNGDIAAVFDAHVSFRKNPYRELALKHAKLLSNDCLSDKETYFNSGVLYVKGNDLTRQFYRKWNTYWKNGIVNGVNMDQPSFAKSQNEMDIVKELNGKWNCQLRHGLSCFADCLILHYLCTSKYGGKSLCVFQDEAIYRKVREDGIESIDKTLFRDVNALCNHDVLTDIFVEEESSFVHQDLILFLKKQYTSNGLFYRLLNACYRLMTKLLK